VVGGNLPGTATLVTWTIPVGFHTNNGFFRVTAVDKVGLVGQALSARIYIIASIY